MIAEYGQLEERVLALMAAGAVTENVFGECALEIHRFQRRHNQPYQNYCEQLGTPEFLTDWKKIPAVPQSAFKQGALRCFAESETAKTFRTK